MKRLLLFAALAAALAPAAFAQTAWINEFHYDNPGGDVNEFIEVALRSDAAAVANYSVVLYNGSGGVVYGTQPLSAFTASAAFPVAGSAQTVTFYSLVLPVNGLQNGSPDGLALVNTATNTVIQFLSYEGTFAATDGPAAGQTSADVGVAEPGATNDTSIGYVGSGQAPADFTYALISGQTPGAPNTGQTLAAGGGPAPETASVTFVPMSATTAENVPYTSGAFVYTLANSDGNPANNPAATGTVAVTSGNAAQVASFTAAYSFAAGTPDGTAQQFTATPADDAVFTGTRTVVFGLTATASTASGTFTLTITDDEAAPPAPPVVINEIDPNTPGTDVAEFVELIGPPNTPLAGLTLVFFNGSNNQPYFTLDLAGQTTSAQGTFVVGNTGVAGVTPATTIPSNGLQNGPDGVALYTGGAPTAPTVAGLVDAIVYGSGADAQTLATALGLPQTYSFDENYEGTADTQSLARLNTGAGVSALLYVQTPTPNAINGSTVTVNETAGVDDVAGYRLLGVPVVRPTGQPLQVSDLAPINLVQGIPAGSNPALNPAQYPQAPGPNLLTTYTGGSTSASFLPPSSTAVGLPPAAGFFWYFYDQDIPRANIPATFGPGTSVSYDLADPAFQLAATGVPVDDRLNGTPTPGPYAATTPVSPNGSYMAANPFAYPVQLSFVQTSSGTVGTSFQVFEPGTAPNSGTFVTLTAADVVSPWQGVFLTVNGATGPTVTLSSSSRNVVPTSNVALVGRSAEARLAFELTGTLASGAQTTDRAAVVRFEDDAAPQWDRHDAAKLTPPQTEFALVALGGTRDGAALRQAVLSLPLAAEATLPLALRATEAGAFTLAWSGAAGVQASLRDLATGTVVDLGSADSYAFTADATDWTDRFELVLGSRPVAGETAPAALALTNPAPNPTTRQAAMTLTVDAAQRVTATVVDALGRTVATVYDADLAAGASAQITVDASAFAPGVYVVRVAGETFAEARRFTVAR